MFFFLKFITSMLRTVRGLQILFKIFLQVDSVHLHIKLDV